MSDSIVDIPRSESPPGICGYSVMIRVAQRATAIIKQDPDQASEAWLELLEHSIDTVLLDLADSKDMLEVLEELRSVTRKIISIRNGELEDEVEGEDAPDEREEEDPEEGERVATS